jgi:ABC-type polysaccharide/polyol phosphate transport system ATPase subunit
VTVIEARNLRKRFRRPHTKSDTLKEAMVAFLRGRRGYNEFWALDDVSFQVQAGEAVGLIGPNGSGKSTLLGMLARVLKPTTGTVSVIGRVCPLLELGTGFHRDLTGRENVYLNASLLGLSHRETVARYDSIVDFAEIADFMDAPVKNYSSGMAVRLGFSVAIHVDPDILLIDEVLGVGDEHFQHKSFAKLLELKNAGKTIFVVSHHLYSVEALCERAIWLQHGKVRADQEAATVIADYRAEVKEQERKLAEAKARHAPAG